MGKISRAISGSLSIDSRSPEFQAIRPRGPDSSGIETFMCHGYCVNLAHSRLSIIDLSSLGRQPMHDPASGWWITYNGEIYNYLELRDELRALGCEFASESDTEVLLKAWAQWGIDAFRRLNGMFALALFHPDSGQLWLVRDRFGVKPLAWGVRQDGCIVFSSSVGGVAGEVGDEIDIEYCARGLHYKVFETERSGSPFKNVRTVPPGSWLRLQLSPSKVHLAEGRWYDLKLAVQERSQALLDKSDNELVSLCSELLHDAVALRLRSDVPVAVALSGGLDSSSIASLASRSMKNLRGFTYGSPAFKASEGPDVEAFSRALGIDVTFVWPRFDSSALSDALERTMTFQEAPFSGLSIVAQNTVYYSARSAGFKVLLGGQGGDESFAGYRKFFIVAMREAMHKRESVQVLRLLYSFCLMMAHEAGQMHMYIENLHRYTGKRPAGFRMIDWKPVQENLWGEPGLSLSGRQIEDFQYWSLPTLLRYEDRNSMGYGVESRLPFMDYRLVETALALPARLKISNGFGKWALRRITAGMVPDSVRMNRKKRGFDVTQTWVTDGVGAALRSTVLDHRKALAGYLRPGLDIGRLLSDSALASDGNLLDEALMLAWLVKPVRSQAAVTTGELAA